MKSIKLLLKTKTSDSLKKILNFLNENINKNFSSVTKNQKRKKKKSVITLLKSPHVNKTSQEQFETTFLLKQIEVITTQASKFLIFLKKIKNSLFADIDLKIKLPADNKSNDTDTLINKIGNFDSFKNDFFFEKKSFIVNKRLKKVRKKKNYYDAFNRNNRSKYILKLTDFYGYL